MLWFIPADKYLEGVNSKEARLVIYIWSKIETSGKLNPRGENNDEGKERDYFLSILSLLSPPSTLLSEVWESSNSSY